MPPEKMTEVQINSRGGTCPQVYSPATVQSKSGPLMLNLASTFDGESPWDLGRLLGGGPQSEDCLFLDVYVPGKALNGSSHAKMPVVNWIYGGGFNLGSKDGLYDGTPIIKAADGNVIYVAANYRLSVLGFLSGPIVEKDNTAVANAGLYDQRAVLEWIRDNIALFGGNPDDVSAWGESAGAASVTHHLTAFGGKQDPLFKKAVLQSPSYNPQYDRNGAIQKVYDQFAAFAGCAGKGLDCLRSKDIHVIQKAQQEYTKTVPLGIMGTGPSVDGQWIRQLPVLELATGNFAKGIESMIVSHVKEETPVFVKGNIKSDSDFMGHIEWNYNNLNFSNHSVVTQAILKKLPSPGPSLKAQNHRMEQYLEHKFTCNTRWVTEAYKDKTWNVQYSLGTGTHGEDILADFFSSDSALGKVAKLLDPSTADLAGKFQSYLVSHARTGDPNTLNKKFAWPKVTIGPEFSNVLEFTKPLRLVTDKMNTADICDFWRDVLAGVTSLDGKSANPRIDSLSAKLDLKVTRPLMPFSSRRLLDMSQTRRRTTLYVPHKDN